MKKIKLYKKITKAAIKRIKSAGKYSFDGVKAMYKSEPAFRQDVLLFVIGLFISHILDISETQKCFLIISLFLIIMAETINTAIEVVVDRISKEKNPLSKKAKDIGSFLVMVSFALATTIWLIILL